MSASDLTPEQMQQLKQFGDPGHYALVRKMQRTERRAPAAAKAQATAQQDAPELVIDFTNLMDRLSVGDMEDIERAAGVPAFQMSFFGGNIASVGGIAALIWVLRRKDDPKYTYTAARAIPARTLMDLLAAFNPAPNAEQDGEAEDDTAPLEPSELPSA